MPHLHALHDAVQHVHARARSHGFDGFGGGCFAGDHGVTKTARATERT